MFAHSDPLSFLILQDYVINQWAEVSRSEEFDTCVLEVSVGE
jgi:hypothetical protein